MSYGPWEDRMTPRPKIEPRLDLIEVCWRMVGPSEKVIECGIYRTDIGLDGSQMTEGRSMPGEPKNEREVCDLVVESPTRRLVMEHTRIESYPEQIADGHQFVSLIVPLESKLSSASFWTTGFW